MQAGDDLDTGRREVYQRRMLTIRGAFDAGASGVETIAARTGAVDELLRAVWLEASDRNGRLASVALLAVGGYGRCELFPQSDVDLLFLLDNKLPEKLVKDSIRWVSQELWDLGIRIAPTTRKAVECERFDAEVAEFTLSLLDHRLLAGNEAIYHRLTGESATQGLSKLAHRDNKAILRRLVEMTRARRAKFGGTLFHLEPNIKDCPGGLRDVHVSGWIGKLRSGLQPEGTKSSGMRWSFCIRYDVFCTTGMIETTTRWTGGLRTRQLRPISG